LGMKKSMGALLFFLGLFLVAGLVSIIGAANREAPLEPRMAPSPEEDRRGRFGMRVAALLIILALLGANQWWGKEARADMEKSYKIPHLDASLAGDALQLHLENPNARVHSGKKQLQF